MDRQTEGAIYTSAPALKYQTEGQKDIKNISKSENRYTDRAYIIDFVSQCAKSICNHFSSK